MGKSESAARPPGLWGQSGVWHFWQQAGNLLSSALCSLKSLWQDLMCLLQTPMLSKEYKHRKLSRNSKCQTGNREAWGTMLLGGLAASPAATFVLANAVVSPSYFLGNRRWRQATWLNTQKGEQNWFAGNIQQRSFFCHFFSWPAPYLVHSHLPRLLGTLWSQEQRFSLISKVGKPKMGVCIYRSVLFLLSKWKKTQKLCTHKQCEEKCHLSLLQEMKSNILLHKDIMASWGTTVGNKQINTTGDLQTSQSHLLLKLWNMMPTCKLNSSTIP